MFAYKVAPYFILGGNFDSITLVNKPQCVWKPAFVSKEFNMATSKSKLREPVRPHSLYVYDRSSSNDDQGFFFT